MDVEIQNKDEKNMTQRSLYYWSKIFSEQIVSGANYSTLKKTICINILDFNHLKNEENYHNVYTLINKESKESLNAPIEIHFIEIKKYVKLKNEPKDELTKWINFLENPVEETMETSSGAVKKAFKELEVLSSDKSTRRDYLKRQETLEEGRLQIESAFSRGIEQGIEQEKFEMAKNLLDFGMEIENIMKMTGL